MGDPLRVEQPHLPAGAAKRSGGCPQVGLVGGGDDGAGRGEDERDRLRRRLARPRCHECHHGVFPGGKDGLPVPATGLHQLPEREPGLRRLQGARVCARQRPAQAHCSAGGRPAGQSPHPRVAGQGRDRVPGRGTQPGCEPDRQHGDNCTAQGQHERDQCHGDRRSVRPRLSRTPVQDGIRESRSERLDGAAHDRSGEPGCAPEQPGKRDQRPADRQHGPAGRASARRGRRSRPERPAHHRSPSRPSRIAWSVS